MRKSGRSVRFSLRAQKSASPHRLAAVASTVPNSLSAETVFRLPPGWTAPLPGYQATTGQRPALLRAAAPATDGEARCTHCQIATLRHEKRTVSFGRVR